MEEELVNQRIDKIINGYYNIALDSLKIFQNSKAKDILLEILNFTISRNY